MLNNYVLNTYNEIIVNKSLLDIQLFVGLSLPKLPAPNTYALILNKKKFSTPYTLFYCRASEFQCIDGIGSDLKIKFPMAVESFDKIILDNVPRGTSLKELPQSKLQDVLQHLSDIQLNKIKEIIASKIFPVSLICNEGLKVGVGNVNKGSLLFSCDFGSCRAVLALLNNDECVLYHLIAINDEDAMNAFISLIKDKATHVYVFQKTEGNLSKNHKSKSPVIAVNLEHFLPKHIKITLVELINYRFLMCSAQEKKIHVVGGIDHVKFQPLDNNNISINSDSIVENGLNFKTVEQCLLDVFSTLSFEIIDNTVLVNGHWEVSDQLITDTAKWVLAQKGNQHDPSKEIKSSQNLMFFEQYKDNIDVATLRLEDRLQIIFQIGLKRELPNLNCSQSFAQS